MSAFQLLFGQFLLSAFPIFAFQSVRPLGRQAGRTALLRNTPLTSDLRFQHFSFCLSDFSMSVFQLFSICPGSFSFSGCPPGRQAGRAALLVNTFLSSDLRFQLFSISAFQLLEYPGATVGMKKAEWTWGPAR